MWPFLQLATGAPALETADLGRVASSWAGWKVLVPEGTVIELASDADVSLRAPELRAHDELWTRVDQAIDRGDPAADALLAQAHAERPEQHRFLDVRIGVERGGDDTFERQKRSWTGSAVRVLEEEGGWLVTEMTSADRAKTYALSRRIARPGESTVFCKTGHHELTEGALERTRAVCASLTAP